MKRRTRRTFRLWLLYTIGSTKALGLKYSNGRRNIFRTHPRSSDLSLSVDLCSENDRPHLVKFNGRPDRPTPKSAILYKLGRSPKAFDHHEWFVSTSDGRTRRYVIDYYSVDDLTFSIDVRPALDDLSSLKARMMKFADDTKSKVTGNDKNG